MAMGEPLDVFDWVGATVAGKYRVEAVVAEGGFGVVYRAQHLGFDTPIALKCLKVPARLQGTERDKFLEAFVAEGKLLHQLSRATVGIVQAMDVGAETSPNGTWTPYLALEWLEGSTLEEDLAARAAAGLPGRTLTETIALLEPAARALAVAHERGIAHRDIKPANLFVTDLGGRRIVKVVDFGIAKVMTEVTSLTRALQATGASLQAFTPQYGAPEQFDRSRYGATGPWSDVFAFALVLVEVLSGRVALDGGDTTQLFIASVHPARRPTPRQCGVHVPDAIEAVMARAVAIEPRDRFHSAGEFWDALIEAAGRVSSHEAFAATALSPGLPQSNRTELAPPGSLRGATGSRSPSTTSPQVASAPGLIPPAPPMTKRVSRLPTIVLAVGGAALAGAAIAGLLALRPGRGGNDGATTIERATTSTGVLPASSFLPTPQVAPTTFAPRRIDGATVLGVAQPDTDVTSAWFDGFAVYRVTGNDDLPLLGAQHGCLSHGLVLCTALQWRRACDRAPAISKMKTWTSEIDPATREAVVHGGGTCATAADVPPDQADPTVAGLCCSRAVAVRGRDLDPVRARRTSERVSTIESATDTGNAKDLGAMFRDGARFFMMKAATRAQIISNYEDQFLKHPDLWMVHDSCECLPDDNNIESADCHKLTQQDGKVAIIVSRYSWDVRSGQLVALLDSRVLLGWGAFPSENGR
jgi:serine/threonine-protein kinase